MNNNEYAESMAWSGNCDRCLTIHVVYPHPDSDVDARDRITEGPSEWEQAFATCFICEGDIEWNGSDPIASVVKHA